MPRYLVVIVTGMVRQRLSVVADAPDAAMSQVAATLERCTAPWSLECEGEEPPRKEREPDVHSLG